MFQNIFRNMTDVVKNLLILNVLMLLAMYVMESRGVNLTHILGMHYVESPLFEPYQIVTYMFMHGDIMHLFFNMFGLVIFGTMLERVWGPKRFFIFYFATGIGAVVLHVVIAYLRLENILDAFGAEEQQQLIELIRTKGVELSQDCIGGRCYNFGDEPLKSLNSIYNSPMVGASGAIMGILVGFAMLFPNTELMLLFPPIPIKAKYLALILIGLDLYMAYANNPGDNIAHFAHLGGALVGFILVMIWKRNRTHFY